MTDANSAPSQVEPAEGKREDEPSARPSQGQGTTPPEPAEGGDSAPGREPGSPRG